MDAIKLGEYQQVKRLLKSYNKSSHPPKEMELKVHQMLSAAVEHKYPLIAKLVMEKFPNQLDDKQQKKLLLSVIAKEDVETFKILLDKGTDHSILHAAAQKGNLEILKILLEKGAHVNARNTSNRIPLHTAAYRRQASVIEYLIGKGGDVNCKDSKSQTPLHCAINGKSLECVKVLLENGADCAVKDRNGQTIFHHAANGAPEVLKYIIDLGKFDVNEKNRKGNTPLHIAACCSLGNTMVLLQHGADINGRGLQGRRPLHDAVSRCRKKIVKYLLTRGADFSAKDDNGWSIAQSIFRNPLGEMFLIFLNHGYDINLILEIKNAYIVDWLLRYDSMLLKEVALTAAQKQFVNGKFFEIIAKFEKLSTLNKACEKEIETMIVEKFEETNNISFFDIVCTKNADLLVRYLRNEKIAKALADVDNFEAKFPNYAYKIICQLEVGKERKLLLDRCKKNCYFVFAQLPIVCFEEVTSFLSNFDLLNLTEACKIKK